VPNSSKKFHRREAKFLAETWFGKKFLGILNMGTIVFKVPHLKIIEPLVIFIITLILPFTLWAATPCSLATQNVIKVYHLRHTLSLA
jgi:hypothetical protein